VQYEFTCRVEAARVNRFTLRRIFLPCCYFPITSGKIPPLAPANLVVPTSLAGQFEQPYGPMGPPTLFTIPVLRYMKTYGLTHEQLAMVSVVQRECATKNPHATFKTPIIAGAGVW
jgi:hypothetical protein